MSQSPPPPRPALAALLAEDRDQAYRDAIRIWRAAGFKDETALFAVPDDRVMDPFG